MESKEQSQSPISIPKSVRTYHYNGNINQEYFEVNGKIEGQLKEYYQYPNGILWKICNYVNGKANGEYRDYHLNGNLATICNYVDGRANGEYKRYDEEGNLIKTEYYVNGVLPK